MIESKLRELDFLEEEIPFGTQFVFAKNFHSVNNPLQLPYARTQLLLLHETLLQGNLFRVIQALHLVPHSFCYSFPFSEIHFVFEELDFLAKKLFVFENDKILLLVFLVLLQRGIQLYGENLLLVQVLAGDQTPFLLGVYLLQQTHEVLVFLAQTFLSDFLQLVFFRLALFELEVVLSSLQNQSGVVFVVLLKEVGGSMREKVLGDLLVVLASEPKLSFNQVQLL